VAGKIVLLSCFSFFLFLFPLYAAADPCDDGSGGCSIEISGTGTVSSPESDSFYDSYFQAEDEIYLFYSLDCPHCHELIEFLEGLDRQDFFMIQYEIKSNPENMKIFEYLLKKSNAVMQGVPTLFIGKEILYGFDSENSPEKIINSIDRFLGYEVEEYDKIMKSITK